MMVGGLPDAKLAIQVSYSIAEQSTKDREIPPLAKGSFRVPTTFSQAERMGFGTKQVVLFSKKASLSSTKIILIGTKQLVLSMKKSWVFYTESTFPCHRCHLVVTDNCLITK